MNVRVQFICLLVCLCYCCTQPITEKRVFYSNGVLKSISFYKSSLDTVEYKRIDYYANGHVEDTLKFNSGGNLDGRCFYSDTVDNSKLVQSFDNGVLDGWSIKQYENKSILKRYIVNGKTHGIEYSYDSCGVLVSEILSIEGEPFAMKKYTIFNPGDTTYICSSFSHNTLMSDSARVVKDTTRYCLFYTFDKSNNASIVGHLEYKNNNIDTTSSYYPLLEIKDTIQSNDKLRVVLRVNLPELAIPGVKVNVKIAEMDSNLKFTGNISVLSSENRNHVFVFFINKYRLGYNLFVAKVEVVLGAKTIKSVLIFDDFTVLPRSS